MPHQCTTCGHVFPDGSTEMLSGCPDCGGNAFQFHPPGTDVPDEPPDVDPPASEDPVGGRVGRAASTVRDLVTSGTGPPDGETTSAAAPWPDEREDAAQAAARGSTPAPESSTDDIIVADEDPAEVTEDDSQRSARAEIAEPDDLPTEEATDASPTDPPAEPDAADSVADGPPADGRVVSEPTGESPDLAELREQLNDQFESIKIVEPGEYELNLMELYEREEYIIALQENGRYVIQMPETWMAEREAD